MRLLERRQRRRSSLIDRHRQRSHVGGQRQRGPAVETELLDQARDGAGTRSSIDSPRRTCPQVTETRSGSARARTTRRGRGAEPASTASSRSREAGPGGDGESDVVEDAVRIAPVEEVGELVGADDERRRRPYRSRPSAPCRRCTRGPRGRARSGRARPPGMSAKAASASRKRVSASVSTGLCGRLADDDHDQPVELERRSPAARARRARGAAGRTSRRGARPSPRSPRDLFPRGPPVAPPRHRTARRGVWDRAERPRRPLPAGRGRANSCVRSPMVTGSPGFAPAALSASRRAFAQVPGAPDGVRRLRAEDPERPPARRLGPVDEVVRQLVLARSRRLGGASGTTRRAPA